VTVSAPIRLTEALVLVIGFAGMLAINLVLLRHVLAPLSDFASQMEEIDLREPARRLQGSASDAPELASFISAFNAMLDRLAQERRRGARAALAAQERERQRVGRALHDEAGQSLTAIALEIERQAADGPPEGRERMAALAAQLHASLEDIRRISRELRPEALDDLGLVNALIALTSRVARQGGLRIERSLSSAALSKERELVVYRVAQEALTNVLRHARASVCTLTLGVVNGEVQLRIEDDGVGFVPHDRSETIGIEGMRERALLGGGTLAIDSTPGLGTKVTMRLPLGDGI
jgi:two-component system sensor histidine kinase UhpB